MPNFKKTYVGRWIFFGISVPLLMMGSIALARVPSAVDTEFNAYLNMDASQKSKKHFEVNLRLLKECLGGVASFWTQSHCRDTLELRRLMVENWRITSGKAHKAKPKRKVDAPSSDVASQDDPRVSGQVNKPKDAALRNSDPDKVHGFVEGFKNRGAH